jgi:adenosine deaminase
MTSPVPAGRDAPSAESFLLRMPKVELHVHLEGTFRPATLLHLAKKNGVALPADDEAGIRRWFRFRDFEQFIEIYLTCSRCLRDPEDFRLLALDFLAEQAVQNVLWSEVHFTISTHLWNGGKGDEIHAALAEAMDDGRRRWGVGMALIPDIVRGLGIDRADATLRWAVDHKDRGVAAMGIGGMELGYSNEPYAAHFDAARAEGLRTVAHAGEHGGPDSIRSAIEHCRAERIDHGIRAVDDPGLVAELREHGTALDVCPSSNVALGAVTSLEQHPLPRLRAAGAAVTVNSDDPPFFATNLTREYLLLHRTWGYGLEDLASLSRAALDHAFLAGRDRALLERRFDEEMTALGVTGSAAERTPSREMSGETSF